MMENREIDELADFAVQAGDRIEYVDQYTFVNLSAWQRFYDRLKKTREQQQAKDAVASRDAILGAR